jgi:hypothetical protein
MRIHSILHQSEGIFEDILDLFRKSRKFFSVDLISVEHHIGIVEEIVDEWSQMALQPIGG